MANVPAQSGRGGRAVRLAIVSGVLIGVLLVYNQVWGPGSGNGDDDTSSGRRGEHAANGELSGADNGPVTTTFPESTNPVEPTCPALDGSSPRQVAFTAAPPMCIDPAKTYVATVETTRGDFTVTLDPAHAPATVNNFVFLSLWHYYDGVGFHRIMPNFVIQGGDAVGPRPGVGGPGYDFPDEVPTEAPFYPPMSLAMANTGPNTNGSQFFIVVGPNGEGLPPKYSRFGTVTAGVPVVDEIEETGNAEGTPPRDLTVITGIKIAES